MPECQLSIKAAKDLASIADYTINQFGIKQARTYRDGLEACFQNLADNPGIGRDAKELAPLIRRFEHQSHVVFYKVQAKGVLIVRVLHANMDATRHL